MSRDRWIPVSRETPCPVCAKPDNCSVSQDGQWVWCGRDSEGAIRENQGGQYLHRLTSPLALPPVHFRPPRAATNSSTPVRDVAQLAVQWATHAGPQLERLASLLGVSVASLTALGVGWHRGVWTFPERDATGTIIGINRRYSDSTKRRLQGFHAGLTYTAQWDTGTGPVFLVEGGSDTAALMDVGFNVIGRPSNSAGVQMIAEMLRTFPADRQIVVIGERDQKPDGRWPGREGAIRTAQGLADRLNRPIGWSFPPGEAKDARAWLLAQTELPAERLASQFLCGLAISEILPTQPVARPRLLETGVGLSDWREQMRQARQNSLSAPGCYTDASPTGAGKSHVDLQTIEQASHADPSFTALIVLPTHENGREVIEAGRSRGLQITAYPARSTDHRGTPNCWNSAADRAEAMGLAVQATVCGGCEQRNHCQAVGYLFQLEQAQQAAITVCTHKRAEHIGLSEMTTDCRYVSIHENPVALLRPESKISDTDLPRVLEILLRLISDPESLDWFGDSGVIDDEGHLITNEQRAAWKEDLYQAVVFLHDWVSGLLEAVRSATHTCLWEPPSFQRWPMGLARLLFRATNDQQVTFQGQPWRFIQGASSGRLQTLAILVETSPRHAADQRVTIHKSVLGVGQNLPSLQSVTWFNDATTTPERLRTLVECSVEDRTPQGRLVLQHKAVQIPRDITRSTTLDVVAGLVRGLLADRLEFPRVGLIVHSSHKTLRDHLEPPFHNRIVRTTYFGSGEERSSNAWHQECDLILVLGTPRHPPSAVASYLIQVGELTAACQPPPWGSLLWQGRSESGEVVMVSSRGYTQAVWQRAYQEQVRATLVQAVGRGRGILDSGCEVVVVSTEECGLPLSDQPLIPLGDSEMEVWSQMYDLSLAFPNNILGKTSVSTADLAHRVSLSEPRIRFLLVSLERRGLARRVGQRGGWLPVDSAPAPLFASSATTTLSASSTGALS